MTNYLDENNNTVKFTINESKIYPNLKLELLNNDTNELIDLDITNATDLSSNTTLWNEFDFTEIETLNNITIEVGSYMYFIYNYDSNNEYLIEVGIIFNNYRPTFNDISEHEINSERKSYNPD